MVTQFVQLLSVLLICAAIFGLVEWLFPSHEDQQPIYKRPGLRADVAYWFILPILNTYVLTRILVAVLVGLFVVAGWQPTMELLGAGFGPVVRQPRWLQIVEAVLIVDLAGYWIHGTFHSHGVWKFHAIHHSPRDLDWLAAARLHPINAAGNRVGQALSIL